MATVIDHFLKSDCTFVRKPARNPGSRKKPNNPKPPPPLCPGAPRKLTLIMTREGREPRAPIPMTRTAPGEYVGSNADGFEAVIRRDDTRWIAEVSTAQVGAVFTSGYRESPTPVGVYDVGNSETGITTTH